MNKRVLLLKKERENDEYKSLLTHHSYIPTFTPVLQFEYINQHHLLHHLQQHTNYSGLICTSQQPFKAIKTLQISMHQWKSKPTFVLGPQSQKLALELGLNPLGMHSLTSKSLSEYISSLGEYEKPLLFLVGDRVTNSPITALNTVGINIHHLTVYKTISMDTRVESDEYDFVVVFSPSGLEGLEYCGDARFVAIGPTTGKALDDLGIENVRCKMPSPEGLLEALESLNFG